MSLSWCVCFLQICYLCNNHYYELFYGSFLQHR